MSAELLPGLLVWYIVFLFSTTFHEFAHAFLAHRGGDDTAHEGGYATLDPLPHIRRSPMGMVLMPVISYLYLGWMVGFASVPYDPEWGRRNPKRQALMSLAGPGANLLLVLISLVTIRALLSANLVQFAPYGSHQLLEAVGRGSRTPMGALAMALGVMLQLNVVLCLFNLIPIPPLDGAGVLGGLFPRRIGSLYERMQQVPAFGFLGLVVAWKVFPFIAAPAFRVVRGFLYG